MQLNLNDSQMDFDATSLNASAMWDEKNVYPKYETGYGFKPHMNDLFDIDLNNESFNQNGIDSAILKINSYNPPSLISQQLPVKEKVTEIEVNGIRNGCIIDALTCVDIFVIAEVVGKVIEIYESVVYRKNFSKSPFRKVLINYLLSDKNLKTKVLTQLMQGLVKSVMNSLYGVRIRNDVNGSYFCKSYHWMKTEYDENALDYWKSPNANYILKMKKDDG